MALADDYFSAGPAIMARIRSVDGIASVEELGDLADLVYSSDAKDVAKLNALARRCPAAFVGYDADVLERNLESGAQVMAQRWLVVLAVRNAAGANTLAAVQKDAGPLLSRLVSALSGWRPVPGFSGLERVSPPRPAFSQGIGFFALAFQGATLFPGEY